MSSVSCLIFALHLSYVNLEAAGHRNNVKMKILENFQENILGKSNINNIFNEDPQLYERSIYHGYGPKMFPNFKNSHSVEYI